MATRRRNPKNKTKKNKRIRRIKKRGGVACGQRCPNCDKAYMVIKHGDYSYSAAWCQCPRCDYTEAVTDY